MTQEQVHDFSRMPNVTTIQRHGSHVTTGTPLKNFKWIPKLIHVYQQSVLEELEKLGRSHKTPLCSGYGPDKMAVDAN